MIEDGLMDRFGIEQVYGMHNMPGIPLGQFAIRPGPMMAAIDQSTSRSKASAGTPRSRTNATIPVLVGAQVSAACNRSSRATSIPEFGGHLVSEFHAGNTHNVIPQTAKLSGTSAR